MGTQTFVSSLALGLRKLKANSVAKLQTALALLEKDVDLDMRTFENFFQFAFKFCLTVGSVAVHSLTFLAWCLPSREWRRGPRWGWAAP
jgi:hypothetical protein